MRPTLRTVKSLMEDVQYALNDASAAVWSVAQLARAYNRAVEQWGDRLRCQAVYTGITSWDSGTYSYTLPGGMDPHSVRPQFRRPLSNIDSVVVQTDAADPWTDFAAYAVEPTSTGAWELRFAFSPPNVDARILHSVTPGRIGYNGSNWYAELTATLSSSATSCTLSGVYDIARQGFVKIDSEWLYYGDYTEDGTNTTLTNLTRGYANTTAALHDTSTEDVFWGVALEHPSDTVGLMDAILAECHRQKLGIVAAADSQYHQQMVTYLDNRTDKLMRQRSRSAAPRLILDPSFAFWT